MGLKICFHCGQPIELNSNKFMLALEKPYTNLWFHRACLNSIEDINLYLTQRVQDVYNYKEFGNKENNGRKTTQSTK